MIRNGVGRAITALCDRDAEYEETAVKVAALLDLAGQDFPWSCETELNPSQVSGLACGG